MKDQQEERLGAFEFPDRFGDTQTVQFSQRGKVTVVTISDRGYPGIRSIGIVARNYRDEDNNLLARKNAFARALEHEFLRHERRAAWTAFWTKFGGERSKNGLDG